MTVQQNSFVSRGWIALVLIGTLIAAGIGLLVAFQTPPSYASRAIVLAAPPPSQTEVGISDLAVTQALMPTLAELATTGPLLERVIEATGASTDAVTLARHLAVRVPANTTLLEVTVLDQDPGQAATLANGIANELITYTSGESGGQAARWGASLSIVDPAVPATTREGPGVLVTGALAGAIGLIVLVSLVFLVANLSSRAGGPINSLSPRE